MDFRHSDFFSLYFPVFPSPLEEKKNQLFIFDLNSTIKAKSTYKMTCLGMIIREKHLVIHYSKPKPSVLNLITHTIMGWIMYNCFYVPDIFMPFIVEFPVLYCLRINSQKVHTEICFHKCDFSLLKILASTNT